MVQKINTGTSESTKNNSQQKTVLDRKDEINSLKDEIASHLHKILDHMDCGETRYAFHEADTTAVKLRQLCDMEAAN